MISIITGEAGLDPGNTCFCPMAFAEIRQGIFT
jgi:hypothetical protein